MELPRFAAVGLSLMLAANCFMPCYTLAYADESQEVEDGLSNYGGAQAGGNSSEAQTKDNSSFTSGSGDSSFAAGLVPESFSSDDLPGESVDGESDFLDLQSLPLLRAGGSFSNSTGSGGGFSGGTPSTRRSLFDSTKWIGSGSSTASLVDTYLGWFSGSNKELKGLVGLNAGIFDSIQRIPEWLQGIHAVSVDTKNYSVSFLPYLEDAYQLQQSQWGYGYGGTAIIQKSSPAWYLQLAANRLNYNGSLTGGEADDYSAARLLARIHNSQYGSITYAETGNTGIRSTIGVLGYVANLLYQNNLYNESATTRLHYVGGLVGEEGSGDYSAARLLARIHNGLYGSITYSETGNTGVRSAISVLGYIANLVYQGDQYLSSTATRLHYIGPLSGVDGEGDYSVARLLARIHNYDYSVSSVLDAITRGPEGGRVSLYNIGNAIETIKNETRDLDNLLESIYDRLDLTNEISRNNLSTNETSLGLLLDLKALFGNSNQMLTTVHYDLSLLRHGVADTLPGHVDYTIWDWLHDIYIGVDNLDTLLLGIQQTLTAWGNRWDAQDLYLMEWAKRWDALDKEGSWSESDKSFLFAKLDGISDRLSVEAGQTILDALIGEVKPQYINDQLTIVKEVTRNRFPFCIPAMMQQMLGLMQSEPRVPHWEFDFFGSPLVLDFGGMEGFASITRWVSCFALFFALLVNTKNFIFDLGGGEK